MVNTNILFCFLRSAWETLSITLFKLPTQSMGRRLVEMRILIHLMIASHRMSRNVKIDLRYIF